MKTHQHTLNAFTKKTSAKRVFVWRMLLIFFLYIIAPVGTFAGTSKPGNAAIINNSPVIQVQIHHININNGDASIIRLIHQDGTETKVLIDGGQLNASQALLPYINGMFSNAHFQYVILTHYHNDHYNGLFALENGAITSEYYVDLGGYNMTNFVDASMLALIQPNDTTCPWTGADGVFGGTMGEYETVLGKAVKHGLKRYMPLSKDNDHIQDMIGVQIPLGTFERNNINVPITLRCVAAWGFTQGNGAVVDNWKRGASKNDPTLGFVLECGEFRYFFGGDMGGDPTGAYIDQETTLASGFEYLYKGSRSVFNPTSTYNGHICGFKANHHGSTHSNNTAFLAQMHASVCITSAGDHSSWHLPSVYFINQLSATSPITLPADIPSTSAPNLVAQGFFFTNLHDFGSPNNSLATANHLFIKRQRTAYGYGTIGTNSFKRGFMITVRLDDPDIDPTKISAFYVVAVTDSFKLTDPAFIFCHQK